MLASEGVVMAMAKDKKTEKCTIFSEEVNEDKTAEKPIDEEMEMIEENEGIVERGSRSQPLSVALSDSLLEAVQLELDTLNTQTDQAFLPRSAKL
ncbi:Testis-specific Y-encoded-like protein 1 [Fukomys damarensis]|uniref:Testis-specific Y-encoded-like protein 1 n=1 Tax=Fukomys damarensis TaxID=885580 RepID=A0A091D6I7_FUKDA|nr:Testis-specific Y-encoded-like protein 1 [Fukomys damarensis]